jgi:putative endonuclease
MSRGCDPPHSFCDDERESALRAHGFGDSRGLAGFAANVDAMPEAWVYLLRCRDGSLYTGWTVDLERRLARHRAGTASRYTASRLPVELKLATSMPDRTTARREEARIKRLPRAAKLALLNRAHQAP